MRTIARRHILGTLLLAVALLGAAACRRAPPPVEPAKADTAAVQTIVSWGYVEDADLTTPGDTAYVCPLGRFASGQLFIGATAQRYILHADSSWSSATVPSLPVCARQYTRLGVGLGPGTLMVPMRLEEGAPDTAATTPARPRPPWRARA